MFRISGLLMRLQSSAFSWTNSEGGECPGPSVPRVPSALPLWLPFPPRVSRLPHRLSLGYLETFAVRVSFLRLVVSQCCQSMLRISFPCDFMFLPGQSGRVWLEWKLNSHLEGQSWNNWVRELRVVIIKNYAIRWLSSLLCSSVIYLSNYHMAGWNEAFCAPCLMFSKTSLDKKNIGMPWSITLICRIVMDF